MKPNQKDLIHVIERQIKTCDEAIERAINLRDKGKIDGAEYARRINLWDNKRHQSATKLGAIKNEN